ISHRVELNRFHTDRARYLDRTCLAVRSRRIARVQDQAYVDVVIGTRDKAHSRKVIQRDAAYLFHNLSLSSRKSRTCQPETISNGARVREGIHRSRHGRYGISAAEPVVTLRIPETCCR